MRAFYTRVFRARWRPPNPRLLPQSPPAMSKARTTCCGQRRRRNGLPREVAASPTAVRPRSRQAKSIGARRLQLEPPEDRVARIIDRRALRVRVVELRVLRGRLHPPRSPALVV